MSYSRLSYTTTAASFHWFAAAPMIGSIASVLTAQNSPKSEKGKWMHRHKSLGLLSGMIVAPRFAYRLFGGSNYNVQKMVGNAPWENMAGKATHYLLYGFMVAMPVSGVAMGYYGGKGLPFFWTTLSGAKEANGEIAKNAFKFHKTVGTYGKFLVPAHAGAAFMHYFRGQSIFARINPFRAPQG